MAQQEGLRSRVSLAVKVASAVPGTGIGMEDTQFAEEMALRVAWAAPLTLLSQKVETKVSGTVDVHWWEDALCSFIDQINYVTQYNSSATSFTVDNGAKFEIGDLVRHVDSDEIWLITAKSSNIISGTRDWGTAGLNTTVDDNDYIQIIGNAFKPGHPLPTAKSTLPVERINYCQEQRTAISMPDQLKNTRVRTGPEMARWEKKANLEHHMKLESQHFFGWPYVGDGTNYVTANDTPVTAGGLNYFLKTYCDSDHLVDQTDLTEYEFMDALEIALGSSDAESLMCFCPMKLLGAMAKWGINKQYTMETTTRLGMNITEFQGFNKIVYFKQHDLLKANSSSEYNYCFFLDMRQIKLWYMQGGATQLAPAGDHSTTGYTRTDEEYMTTSALECRLANNHLRLRFKTYSV
jgi:hypothetical protein